MFSRIFVERPRLAIVISIIITLAGAIALLTIPVAQYPEITPPQVTVSAFYPGADAQTVADSVAAPIEAEVNGVDRMLYMSSTCSNNGSYSLTVTFEVGSDPDIDQVNLQNRVQLATPKLPKEVINQGLSVKKRSSDMLCAISFYSPKQTHDKLFLSNYVSRFIKDDLVRLEGINDAMIFGEMEYSMRVWLNPDKLSALGLTPLDVINAIREQNIQAAVGSIGKAPANKNQQLQFTLRAKGRLKTAKEFGNIILRINKNGGTVRLKDVARIELGGRSYSSISILNNAPTLGMALYRTTGANALKTMDEVRKELKRLSSKFPPDFKYNIIYDTTTYVRESIKEIKFTLLITFLLVLLVNFIFLQEWRATIIPTIAIPVSLIGTFAVLLALGLNANTISLFALVLAIGLVVDDAIVVVENVHRIMDEENLPRKEATIKAMEQVTGPIIATTLVLLAVFVPVGFIPGITGKLYKQFAVTISVSVIISAINSLTLSPALCATFLKPAKRKHRGFFKLFNWFLNKSRNGYVAISSFLIKKFLILILLVLGIYGATYYFAKIIPSSFIPNEDQGAFFIDVQLPEGATLSRTDKVMHTLTREIKSTKGIKDVLCVSGFSILSGGAENVGFGIAILEPWEKRKDPKLYIDSITSRVQRKLFAISSANIFAFDIPPIHGLGTTGGFDYRLLALKGQSPQEMASVARSLVMAANQNPKLMRVFSTYTANTPQLFIKLDRSKAEQLNTPITNVYNTLQSELGSIYVNDFNLFGRVYQVKIQADAPYRSSIESIDGLYVRNKLGKMIPMRSLVKIKPILAPRNIYRYNQYPSVQINGTARPGISSSEAMDIMGKISRKMLPKGFSFDWSSISFQELKAKGQVSTLFFLALVFAYLFLVGQYESWTTPLSIILYIPVATLGAFLGLWITGISLSIYAQIGIVMLVGLASKNAILIVEFARDKRKEGFDTEKSAIEGAKIRFRPVLMTAFTFILGVFPLVIATGAGANSRRHIGTAVFSGMLMATLVGIILIPGLYYIFQSMAEKLGSKKNEKKVEKKDKNEE